MPRTLKEQIESAKEEIDRKENRLKSLLNKQKERDRKARTKRLIERGAILESLISDASAMTNEQIGCILNRTVGSQFGKKVIEEVKRELTDATPDNSGDADNESTNYPVNELT